MTQDYYIIDTTLRDGEQTPGVAFSKSDKITIAKELDQLGVDIIEAGIPTMGNEEIETIKEIASLGLNAMILTWNRMNIEDIKKSLQTGVRNVHITVPASDLHMQRKLKMNRQQVLERAKEVVTFATENNCSVSIGAEDASRADEQFLIDLYKTAKNCGAVRVRYADTVGKLDPFKTHEILSKITSEVDVYVDFHGHNDLGMGTANALAAYKAGAKYISCSVNGLGERAGNTALEEIVMALRYTYSATTNIDIMKFMEVSKIVEKLSGKKLHDGKPIVGKEVFSHESGIHVDGLIKDAETYEYISPQDIGRERKVVLGKFSGTSAIIYKFAQLGYKINTKQAHKILAILRDNDRRGNIQTMLNRYTS